MERNTRAKNILLIVLLVAVLTLSVAYAFLSQTLSITSQATVGGKDANWNVRFTAATCTASGNATVDAPFSPTNTTSLTGLAATLRAPGDYINCEITVENLGTIDADLTTFTLNAGNITYTGSGATKTADEAKANGLLTYAITYSENDVVTAARGQVPGNGTVDDSLPAPDTSQQNARSYRNIRLRITLPTSVTDADLPNDDVVITGYSTTFLYEQD